MKKPEGANKGTAVAEEPVSRERLLAAGKAGLDYLVRSQMMDEYSADYGRLPFDYDLVAGKTMGWTMNWGTGIAVEALLCGYRAFNEQVYLDTAERAVSFMKSLQVLDAADPVGFGTFREYTPQWNLSHPRDALTAAAAMLTWVEVTGDEDAARRVKLFADWFCREAMQDGYPRWSVSLDPDVPSMPEWYGSFHSGSALFFARLLQDQPCAEYHKVMCDILDRYNRHHLGPDGRVTVIRDRKTNDPLDGHADEKHSNREWEVMHVYNDDFGALANLAAWKLTGNDSYRNAARRFLTFMAAEQRADGGFGPKDHSVHSAGGTVLLEMLAARTLGLDYVSRETIRQAARYLLNIQVVADSFANGGFIGYQSDYSLTGSTVSMRSTAYAITAFLHEHTSAHLNIFSK